MPFSDEANKPWTMEQIRERIRPRTVLDVGAGAGRYAALVREAVGATVFIEAAEVWEPYIFQYQLLHKYNAVSLGDIRDRINFQYDLVILGDVLEHMTEDDAVEVWDRISRQAGHAIISIPIIHYHQDEMFGNPFEKHVVEDWTTERVLDTFPGIVIHKEFDVTGVFIGQFY